MNDSVWMRSEYVYLAVLVHSGHDSFHQTQGNCFDPIRLEAVVNANDSATSLLFLAFFSPWVPAVFLALFLACAFVLQLLLEQREKNLLSWWLKTKVSHCRSAITIELEKARMKALGKCIEQSLPQDHTREFVQSHFFLHPTKLDGKIIIASKCLLQGT